MTRWEYLRVQVDANNIKTVDSQIDDLGRQGWELAGTVCTQTYVHFWFKRPAGGFSPAEAR
jgi:hypothetical protein